MRPVRITVEGFSAYRNAVEVDFSNVDFFSLTGHTGSGKSSLIDAMIFALFGRVPRLGGNAVAPAITAGADRARVRFDFEVDGDDYTVVRLAQRTPSGGASVKEARLQSGETVLADGADDVTGAVEDLLKLRFDDFTRTVVLPQGDFARFLTATKSERQGLLRNLLGLEVYTRMRELARTRAAVATERAETAELGIQSLDLVDSETAAAAARHRDDLAGLADEVTGREKSLVVLDAAAIAARTEEERLSGSVRRLDSIEPPRRLEELDTLTTQARDELDEAEAALQAGRAGVADTEAAISALPRSDELATWGRARSQLEELEARLGELQVESTAERLAAAEAELTSVEADLGQTQADLAQARVDHAAHALATTLVRGEPCPVCDRVVEDVPVRESMPEIDDLVATERSGVSLVAEARQAIVGLRTELTRIETARGELSGQRVALLAQLEEAPDVETTQVMLSDLEGLKKELGDRRERVTTIEDTVKTARARLEDLAETSRQVGRRLTEAQLQLAAADLEPPLSESDDVLVQWKELMAWCADFQDRLTTELVTARSEVAKTTEDAAVFRRSLVELLEKHQVPAKEPYAVQVATALQDARHLVEAHEKAVADSVTLRSRADAATRDAAIASALSNHLRANGFEQWLMVGALAELVDGANDLLAQLSAGGYSLHSDESGAFSIVDHRNADEIRSVATLSGGETFLVSLALALSLAETLAAKGGAGLDAIILDEGFGALDDESLDTVAAVLEELSGRGLMVGVITHVKELAARAPVRYEVTREPTGANVRLLS